MIVCVVADTLRPVPDGVVEAWVGSVVTRRSSLKPSAVSVTRIFLRWPGAIAKLLLPSVTLTLRDREPTSLPYTLALSVSVPRHPTCAAQRREIGATRAGVTWTPSVPMATVPFAVANPMTSTGRVRLLVVPSPRSPPSLAPQHLTPPPLATAQVWNMPTAIAAAPRPRPRTAIGARLLP